MTRMLKHYAEHVEIITSKVLITALRCVHCQADFHIDMEPRYCPNCGTEVSCIIPFGTALVKPWGTLRQVQEFAASVSALHCDMEAVAAGPAKVLKFARRNA